MYTLIRWWNFYNIRGWNNIFFKQSFKEKKEAISLVYFYFVVIWYFYAHPPPLKKQTKKTRYVDYLFKTCMGHL